MVPQVRPRRVLACFLSTSPEGQLLLHCSCKIRSRLEITGTSEVLVNNLWSHTQNAHIFYSQIFVPEGQMCRSSRTCRDARSCAHVCLQKLIFMGTRGPPFATEAFTIDSYICGTGTSISIHDTFNTVGNTKITLHDLFTNYIACPCSFQFFAVRDSARAGFCQLLFSSLADFFLNTLHRSSSAVFSHHISSKQNVFDADPTFQGFGRYRCDKSFSHHTTDIVCTTALTIPKGPDVCSALNVKVM